jgi:uncharacterized iron-regulated membrane protein
MRWMMIALLVSLAALLMAAAGMARHIWLQRTRLCSKPPAGTRQTLDSPHDTDEETSMNTQR